MSFLPLYNSILIGSLLVSIFFWEVRFIPIIIALLIVSLIFFWFDLMKFNFYYESAFWLFIVREAMAFGRLLLCCFWFDTCKFTKLSYPLEIPLLGCFLLLGSRITVTGFHHLIPFEYSWVLLLLTLLLGVAFVALQIWEMNEILVNILGSRFHACCFCTVGLHFSHVLLGVVALATMLFIGSLNFGFYRCSLLTWYWHFVDYIWLFVYTFVYVC